jgi:hypothetical protein
MAVAESGSPKYTVWNVAIVLPSRDGRGEQAGRHQAGGLDALADGPVQGPDEVQRHEHEDRVHQDHVCLQVVSFFFICEIVAGEMLRVGLSSDLFGLEWSGSELKSTPSS